MRLFEGRQEGGSSIKNAPISTKTDTRKAVDVAPSLRLQGCGIDLVRNAETHWRFSLIVDDSVNTNRSAARYIVSEVWKYPRLSVYPSANPNGIPIR